MRSQRWLHIIPVAFIMYTIAFIDRTNVSLALPSMSRDAPHEPYASRRRRGSFLLGIRAAANSRRTSGATLERQTLRRHPAGRVGPLLGRLRLGPDLAAILGDALLAGGSGGRGVARRAGVALALVPAGGTRARQCLLDALPSHCGDCFISPFGMDFGPMELARAADCRGRLAFLLAGHLVGLH